LNTPPASSSDKTNTAAVEQLIQQRREKKERLLKQGRTPHGRRFERSYTLAGAAGEFDPKIKLDDAGHAPLDPRDIRLAGRLMTRRDLGKLCFAHLQDQSGKLQLKISKQEIGDELYKEFLKDVDLRHRRGFRKHDPHQNGGIIAASEIV